MDASVQELGGLTSRLQEIVDEAARALGRPVAIDDRHHRILVYTEHPPDEVDAVRLASILRQPASAELLDWLWRHGVRTSPGPVRIPASKTLGLDARVCVPIRCQTHLLGFLWLTDRDESIGPAELKRAQAAAEEAGVVLYREIMLRDLDRGREREFIRDVLSPDPGVRAHAVEHLVDFDLLAGDGPVAVIVVRIVGHHANLSSEAMRLSVDAALMRARRWLAPKHGVHLLRHDYALMLVSLAEPGIRSNGRLSFARRLHEEVVLTVTDLGELRCVVAVGGAAPSPLDANISHRQAVRAAEVATAVSSFGDVVDWDDLGVYRVLAELPLERLGPEDIHPALREVLDDPRHHALLLTVECYLDNAGDAQTTARDLHLHRTSLYHRLSRFERVTGVDLKNGDDRLMVHLTLRLARLQGYSWVEGDGPRLTGDTAF